VLQAARATPIDDATGRATARGRATDAARSSIQGAAAPLARSSRRPSQQRRVAETQLAQICGTETGARIY